jgi:transposase
MKKTITRNKEVSARKVSIEEVAGLDVGDKYSQLCVLDRKTGSKVEESRIQTTARGIRRRFEGVKPMLIALEVGTHSAWISQLLKSLGHETVVANSRRVGLIFGRRRKNDKVDAESLARLARADLELLYPIVHRGAQAQADLSMVRSREILVRTRTKLINHVRQVVKTSGHRLPSCSTEAFARKMAEHLPAPLRAALLPVVETIGQVSQKIRDFERDLERKLRTDYPEGELLLAINGVGTLTAITYLLVLEDPHRFSKSRSVGAYLGLVPAQDSSGERDPELPITREGDALLRRLLVQCGHYILGPFGKECDLRRHGMRIVQRGGKAAKKRAAVAVARKLSVVLHTLWRNGEIYDPDHAAKQRKTRRPAA